MASGIVHRSNFVEPHFIEELGCEGLTAADIGRSLGTESFLIRQKLREGFSERLKTQGYQALAITRANKINGLPYEEIALTVPAAKFFVAKYDSPFGDAYLSFLLSLENRFSKMSNLASKDLLYNQMLQNLTLREMQIEAEQKIAALENRVALMDGDTGYSTILAYARIQKVSLPIELANSLGRKAANVCRVKGIPIGKVPDERHGSVNSYPRDLLAQIFEEMGL